MSATATQTGETQAGAPAGARLAVVFHALASEQRMEIIRLLAESAHDEGKTCCAPDELCACKLAERLGLAPSTVSHHMTVLVEAGLVAARPEGKWVYYALRRAALRAAAERLNGI
jgi:DNA-binding transcriptional ArsR family regulator